MHFLLRRLAGAAVLSGVLAVSGCASHQGPAASPAVRPAASAERVGALRADLDRVFGASIMQRGVWGVDVRSLDSGDVLYSLNADKLMMPASNLKIVTVAAAAETLGWDYRFKTTLETRAPVVGGILEGDLIVRGTGDPTINTRNNRAAAVLDEWAAALRSAGISSINGRIVGDDQAFDDEGIGPGWSWDYLQYGYAAPVGALQFNENVARLTVAPAQATGHPAIVMLSEGSGFTIVNRATTGPAGSAITIDYTRHLDRPVLEITGSVPLASDGSTDGITRTVAVVNPTVFFARQLKDGLAAHGIRVSGEAVDLDDVAGSLMTDGAAPADARVLATTDSPPLRDIATVLMKVSQNLYAETLLKAAGASRGGLGTWAAGLAAARAVLASWGVAADAFVRSDGSGLSRYNYVTPRTLTAVLERMHAGEQHRDAFVATLPIAGKDGTIATRMRGSRAEGNAVAKTGSIANVRSLSGFVRTRNGETLVFSVLANDFVIPSATVNWIADLAVEILSNFTRGS